MARKRQRRRPPPATAENYQGHHTCLANGGVQIRRIGAHDEGLLCTHRVIVSEMSVIVSSCNGWQYISTGSIIIYYSDCNDISLTFVLRFSHQFRHYHHSLRLIFV